MKKKLISNPALTLGLAFLVPIFFVFSQNSHMVSKDVLLFSCGIAVICAGFLVLLANVGIEFWKRKSVNYPQGIQRFAAVFFCLLVVETCCFFFQMQLHSAIPEPHWLRILVCHIFPVIILLFIIRIFSFRPVNIFLAIFLSLSVINMGVSLSKNDKLMTTNFPLALELKKRPNIYLFFLESYHSLDVQRKVYGIDTSEIENYLAKNDFVDYGKIYSNSGNTLQSYMDTFSFRHSWEYDIGDSDAMWTVRLTLGGAEGNTLFRFLKANGYATVLLVGDTDYFGFIRGKFLDDSDRILAMNGLQRLFFATAIFFEHLNTHLYGKLQLYIRTYFLPPHFGAPIYTGPLESRVSQAMAFHKQSGSPFFLAFKGGAQHVPSYSHTWQKHQEWIRSGTYQKSVKSGNQELQNICDAIIANDPGALIILIGDHGAFRFLGAQGNGRDMKSHVEEKGIFWQDFYDDRFAVFLAIRLPYGQYEDISYGLPMSHVNLFRHIFAYLNQDRNILATREPSNSYLGETIVITKD
jgi:hypothetical protein